MAGLEERAKALGIAVEYEGTGGQHHRAPDATLAALTAAFGDGAGPADATLRAPGGVRCHLPDGLRGWGVAVQLYQLRSDRNWGIGDFADLLALAPHLAAAGADFVGLNPVHSLFLADPAACSPFSPSDRRFLNPLYLAVDRMKGFVPTMADPAALRAVRGTDLVDYPAVAALKLRALRAIWMAAGSPDADPAFCAEDRDDLDRHALFEAVSAHMAAQGHGAAWTEWPADWQEADGPAIRTFAADHAAELAFHRWLQQETDRQLAAAHRACLKAGMRIGLYLDFAVGEARGGAGSWGRTDVLNGVRIGAPPDYFNESGQDWGLMALSPVAMTEGRAAPFAALMRRAMTHAGALRIDHAMGLWQLFLIPDGTDPSAGTYARYPVGDMLTALADASHARGAMIIGEDLGNVPDGFRAVMDEVGILSYRILLFERGEAGYIPPADYPVNAMVCLSTHDLPTFQGWWQGDDIRLRRRFGLVRAATAEEQTAARKGERRDLLNALAAEGLIAPGTTPPAEGPAPEAIVTAVHRFLARAPSRLMAVRLEDLAGELRPVNLPSTTDDDHPNWRPKLRRDWREIVRSDRFGALTQAIAAERPRNK
ncbi:4-alpha-glucanotransferase [Falsirhodobacter algicola]|uniref:4-alpha-glucanotransferase n=1 Tax=Falsirhodobacter algicola TaxID=2692330 RepID=A0A8J8SLS1_9RHOB|nr:4-alpha-glucanotransferase [Falsirhodobacter algicola]QUS36777.1 4-alpha-glucanotransferase [Falsirhodobacter algicola]